MAFVKSRVGNGRGGNHISIIAKHQRGTVERYSNHTKSTTEINDLLGGLISNHECRSIGGCLYSLLLLANGKNGCLVAK
jgi:hypothetical protein